MSKRWIIYDERYHTDPDRASVLEAFAEECGWNLKSVTRERNLNWPNGVIVESVTKG